MLPLPSGRHFEKPGLKQFTTAESGTRISAELQGTLQSTFMQLFFKHLTHWKKKNIRKREVLIIALFLLSIQKLHCGYFRVIHCTKQDARRDQISLQLLLMNTLHFFVKGWRLTADL